MVWTDCHECPLVARSDERAATGAEGGAVVSRAVQEDAIAGAEIAADQVYIAITGPGEVVNRDPFLVLAGSAGRAIDRRHPGGAIVIGAKHLDGVDAETQGGEVKASGCIIARKHRVACIAARIGWQGSTIGKRGATVGGSRKSGKLVSAA